MLDKIKELSLWKQIIIGLVALISLPITILVIAIDLSITGIKKKEKSKAIFGIILTIIMINMFLESTVSNEDSGSIVENVIIESGDNKKEEIDTELASDNKSLFGTNVVRPVLNGSETEKIGDRLEVIYDGTEFTKSNFLEFYNSTVKDKSYNYATIKIDKETGITFPGCLNFFDYGVIDKDGIIIEDLGSGEIKNDDVIYKSIEN